ncbi:2-methoxy-6-polyprenyl-1,4-benzoquinol methylase, mitochondrial isoform X1 [Zea mays]|nr:2-methoxy-6-polyprenyl-1,4-benzoquinol methylase, mitochondrial isoform X1 [Zea mays]|eukprot:XP_008663634.1 2-methoxy-6-polyprenyl-1,4-benzoquinol methylase, mitochondrial isoform X1 [Zea mays]
MKWQVFVVCVSLIKGTHIYVCDINPNMLNVGKKCVAERGYSEEHCLSWIQGDAEALSFEDGSMDGYTIAFGIRNVTHIEKALSEAYSYDAYSFSMIPAIGELVDGDRQIEDRQHANQACEP